MVKERRLFIFLSEVLGRDVVDDDGHWVGFVHDVAMRITEEVFPRAESIIVRRGFLRRAYARIPIEAFEELGRPFQLKIAANKVSFQPERIISDFSLRRHILDQQVVDTHNQKVERVNDVHLLRVDGQLYIAHVDVGLRGLIRRLDWTPLVDMLVHIFVPRSPYLTQESFISWKNAQVLSLGRGRNVLRSAMAREKLSLIPPTQLADIMTDLDVFEKISFFKSFHPELQRRVFTDMAPLEKIEIIEQLSDREVVTLLETIPADEATDLLMQVPKEMTRKWMRLMHTNTSRKLRKLLGFAKDSAGGLMTTEYLSLPRTATVGDALEKIKNSLESQANIFSIYIVDDENHFLGMTTLRRFFAVDPATPLVDTCYPQKLFVYTDGGVEEVALLMEKYKSVAVPVVSENNVLEGVITSDDVMEELIALVWRKYKDQL